MNERLIQADRSVIVAADVDFRDLASLVKETSSIPGIGGYKVGAALGLEVGLGRVVNDIRGLDRVGFPRLPIIYDHQKAATDIPDTATQILGVCKRAGVDAVILFPHAGPATQERWTKTAQDLGLHVLVGLHMTHPQFLDSEGGYIADQAPKSAFELAVKMEVRNFVVPGTKTEFVSAYKDLLDGLLGKNKFDLYAPGFISQGGDISEIARVAGDRWHAIVGSAIYKAKNVREAAERVTSQIR